MVRQIPCPVSDCDFESTLSQVIHHVTGETGESHQWAYLGYSTSFEFRQEITANESAEGDSEKRDDSKMMEGTGISEMPITEVAGVGATRAAALSEAGYTSATDLATASVGKIACESGLNEPVVRCIRTVAREACGFDKTPLTKFSQEINAEHQEIAEAYAELAPSIIQPTAAKATLEDWFTPTDLSRSVREAGYSIRYLHFLSAAGFASVDDVATASIDELCTASYVGESLANSIRDTARLHLDEDQKWDENQRPCGGEESTTTLESTDEPSNAENEPEGEMTGGDDWVVDYSTRPTNPRRHDKTPMLDEQDTKPLKGGIPAAMRSYDQWLLWKPTDDGRKIPRAPWMTGDPFQYVSAVDPANQTTFDTAREWQEKLDYGHELAFVLTRDDPFVFLDLDAVIEDESLSQPAQDLIERADSYAAWSTSGTGAHIFVQGELTDGIKSLTGPLDDNGDAGSLEVYDCSRFVAITGDHIDGTPEGVAEATPLLRDLETRYGSISSTTPDSAVTPPKRSRAELRDIGTTSEIQDVFDAISQTRPSDITLQSTQAREHSDGTFSYDPSWANSKSGTRLGVLDDVFIYRKGMIALNALQVVALEEGIITDERDYPEGEAFWEAVSALRNRGAHIPEFEYDPAPVGEIGEAAVDIDESEIARRINYGKEVRVHLHRYDQDYQERLAIQLAPIFSDIARELALGPEITYRAAAVYGAGHAAGVVLGSAHESTIGGAFRIASIEAGTPRPLADVAAAVDETSKSVRKKFHRLIQETAIGASFDPSDLVVDPVDYIPYIAGKLGYADDDILTQTVTRLLSEAELDGASSPVSEVASAYYVALRNSSNHTTTQDEVAHSVGITSVTIRNNYRKFTALI